MCIFSLLIILCLKCQELIFAMFQFSPDVFFVILCRHPLEVISAPIYKLINIVRNLTCWHAYFLHFRNFFSCVLIFVDGNFRFFSGRENYNRAKINVLKVYEILRQSLKWRQQDRCPYRSHRVNITCLSVKFWWPLQIYRIDYHRLWFWVFWSDRMHIID